MKLGLHAYQRYYQVCADHGPLEAYLGVIFDPKKGRNRSKFIFGDYFLKTFSYCVTMKLGLQVYWRYFQVYVKLTHGSHILYILFGDCWTNFQDLKAILKPVWSLMHTSLVIFPRGPRGASKGSRVHKSCLGSNMYGQTLGWFLHL